MTDQLFGAPDAAVSAASFDDETPSRIGRWVMNRAGIVNVWQYDRAEFRFAGGRALLRGKNGAGKSKALEVLLPFLLDGDTRTIDASGRDRTTVGWLMSDGREPGNHVGYVWLELRFTDEDGVDRFCTLGAGLKSSSSTKQTSTWFFLAEDVRVGADLAIEEDGQCYSIERLKAQLGEQVTTSPAEHRRRVAQRLFGLRDEARYANLIHLLHRLRDPNIGNRIEAGELAAVLRDALPPASETALESGAQRFDALEQIREQLDRTQRTAAALSRFMESYVAYAQTVLRARARAVMDASIESKRTDREVATRERELAAARAASKAADAELRALRDEESDASAELEGLRQSDAYKQHLQLVDRRSAVHAAAEAARIAKESAESAKRGLEEAEADLIDAERRSAAVVDQLEAARTSLVRHATDCGVDPVVVPALLENARDEDAIATVRTTTVAALQVARGRLRRADALLRSTRSLESALRDAVAAEAQADRSEQDLLTRQSESDRARNTWVDVSAAWRDEVRAWTSNFGESGVDWSDLHARLRDGPASAEELALSLSAANSGLGPERARARQAESVAEMARASVVDSLGAKEAERTILARSEEALPSPGRYRSAERNPAQGAPLYQLVDFRPEVPGDVRAGLEAAIEASGLLDAWVDADGVVSDPVTQDVFIGPGLAAIPPGLGDLRQLLVPAVAGDSPVSATTVALVLGAIGLGDQGERPWVSTDGRWSLGPLRGAWTKPQAEYLGAGARRATRERQLGVLAADCEKLRLELATAHGRLELARKRRELLDELSESFPSARAVDAAEAAAVALDGAVEAARGRHNDDRRGAERVRATAARVGAEVAQAGAADNLPTDPEALEGIVRAARELDGALQRWETMLDDLSHRVQEVVRRAQRLTARREDAAASTAQADALHDAHRREAASLEALEGAMRATIDEVLASIEATTARRDGARAAVPEAEQLSRYRADQAVRAEGGVERARDQFARTNADLDAAVGRLETALLLPGTARAALGRDLVQAVDLLEGQASVSTSPMVAVAGSVFEETHDAEDVTDRVILNRYDELQAALAGGYDIAVDEEDGIKYFHVSDDTGRQPLPTVAARVEADAETARTRLAASERDVIIRFLLGELGDELRERLLEAEDLVAAANTALADVRTSHGKGARLEWKVDPDEADEVRTARQLLLLRPRTAEEDAELQTALLSLIRTQREQDPAGSYLEHLRQALDYRDWHRFTVQVLDDARPGSVRTLSSRLGLSQGEQRVLSYLALFAAASASFEAIGGEAPRLLLLDDAFAKVDEPTHGRLLELLVRLNLDFLITSERLWGCFATVPSLEIYEALREPTVPGVAFVHFHWDGRQRHLVGL